MRETLDPAKRGRQRCGLGPRRPTSRPCLRRDRRDLGRPPRERILELKGHDRWVYTVAFHPDGKQLASGGWDQSIKIWDAARGVIVRSLAGHRGFVTKLAYGADGRRLASCSEDRSVRVWDAETGRGVATLLGHPELLHALAFGPDGRNLASGSVSGEVKLWNLADVEPVRLPPPASW